MITRNLSFMLAVLKAGERMLTTKINTQVIYHANSIVSLLNHAHRGREKS